MNTRKLSIIVLITIALLSVGAGYLATKSKLDYNFESFFPQGDKDTEFFSLYRVKFETDNDFLLIGVENSDGIFQKEFLERVNQLTDTLATLHGVTGVTSPTNYYDNIMSSFTRQTFKSYPLRWKNDSTYAEDSARIYQRRELVGTYFASDAKSLAIHVKTKAYLGKEGCDSLSQQLYNVVPNFGFEKTHMAGRCIAQTVYLDVMMGDLQTFMVLSVVLLVIFLIIAFRSFWGVWVPLIVVLLSIIWILGFVRLLGEPINLMLTILPTILSVVGISDIIHIVSRYLDELRNGEEKSVALRRSFKEVSIATFLTSATTAIGFLTLMSSNVKPIQQFGIFTAVGVMFAYILAYSVLPSVLVLHAQPKIAKNKRLGKGWKKLLSSLFLFVLKRPVHVIIGGVVLIAICIYGASRIEAKSFLLEDLKEDNELRQDMTFFDEKYSGVRPFEMGLWLTDSLNHSFLDRDVLEEMDQLESYLYDTYEVGFIYSPLQLIKYLNRSSHGGDQEYLKIPESDKDLNMIVKMIEKTNHKDYVKSIMVKGKNLIRITGKIGDWGSAEVNKRNDSLRDFFENKTTLSSFSDYKITGTAALIDKNNDTLVSNLVTGLAIAFVIISLIVGLMYRSVKLVFISLIPNVLPLLMIAAIMGFSGIDLKVSTSIIFTIVFGIAVDDTIHFMSKLKFELRKNKLLLYALKRTYMSTGRAIILTSLILFSGFLTLLGSDFLVTFYMGLLVGFALLFAVVADLILLPALIIVFYRK